VFGNKGFVLAAVGKENGFVFSEISQDDSDVHHTTGFGQIESSGEKTDTPFMNIIPLVRDHAALAALPQFWAFWRFPCPPSFGGVTFKGFIA